jgi:rare lipoprotein A
MKSAVRKLRRWLAPAAGAVLLAGCGLQPVHEPASPSPAPRSTIPVVPTPTPEPDSAPKPSQVPPNIAETPNAVPRPEPRSASGNPPEYIAFGKTYHVLKTARGYDKVGWASWYGRKFQGKPTASGEPYNMFKMTAAHPTLPIPSYVRVTNLQNRRSCIVRINDRGPFHGKRIIDLSYAAAAKLGMLKHGSAKVRVQAVSAKSGAPAAHRNAALPKGRYLQAGAFRDPIDAVAMSERIDALGLRPVHLASDPAPGVDLHRVLLGPFHSDTELGSARQRLSRADIPNQIVSR